VVCDLRFGLGRLEWAVEEEVRRMTCWAVDSRMSRWCRAAYTVVSPRGTSAAPSDVDRREKIVRGSLAGG
jgi:hypothetical protein